MWMTSSGLAVLLTIVAALVLIVMNQKIRNIQVSSKFIAESFNLQHLVLLKFEQVHAINITVYVFPTLDNLSFPVALLNLTLIVAEKMEERQSNDFGWTRCS